MSDLLRNHLSFHADFPTDGAWIGDEPDPAHPAGRELTEFLLERLAPELPLSEIWNEEGYGWSFNLSVHTITVNVLVQRLEHWLVIVREVSLKPRFLRGPKYRQAFESVCQKIAVTTSSDPRFRDVRFCSYEEYNQPARTRDERGHQLQSEIRKGLDSGPGQPWDAEALKKKARSRLGGRESD
jgi:hypothetical protein